MVRSVRSVCLVAGLALAGLSTGQTASQAKLNILSPAPPIKVARWAKGTPIKTFTKGKVYVIEFWATWCHPCREGMPHLSQLAEKYRGKAQFIGVSIFEAHTKDYIDSVAAFVKGQGKVMDYDVAIDGVGNEMANTWVRAAGSSLIPTAFIVDQSGKIAWIGHPELGLDEAVGQVIAGTFDPVAAAKTQKHALVGRGLDDYTLHLMTLMQPVLQALSGRRYKDAVTELDKLFVAYPELVTRHSVNRFWYLLQAGEEPEAYAYARKLAAGLYKNDGESLAYIAGLIVQDHSDAKHPDNALALSIAEQSYKVANQPSPHILDVLATAEFRNKRTGSAIETEQRAISLAEKDKEFSLDTLKEMRARLETFKAARNTETRSEAKHRNAAPH